MGNTRPSTPAHGEPDAVRVRISHELGWQARAPSTWSASPWTHRDER